MSFPINEKAFEKRGTELLAVGNDRQTKNINDSSLYIGNITRKEYDQLCDIINNTNYLRFGNTDIFRIIFEEVDLMFSNEQTPEKTAANIQNRVSILLNE